MPRQHPPSTWTRSHSGNFVNLDYCHTIELMVLSSPNDCQVLAHGAVGRSLGSTVLYEGTWGKCCDVMANLGEDLGALFPNDASDEEPPAYTGDAFGRG